uniref:Myb/SANT-like DNA-binding domain-containing protein n=1 Tax=Kalanchoe fedtschenkoi TaxID=63787 RepID=A0A7N0TI10_KALFE
MDNSGLGCGFLSGLNGVMLDLESPINKNQQVQMDPSLMNHQHHVDKISGLGLGHHSMGLFESRNCNSNGISMNFGKGKAIAVTSNENTSDDDEDLDGDNCHGPNEKRRSPWHRMKWTDNVVRLLISAVACVGDDGSLDGVEGLRRKSGILQKKGKWKTVSKIMISKGCSVSPQQCEDKFNDLNKRYKRLNEILGRGTSCRVVENPALMDSMPNLSSKMKDVVRKILCSKHLFYQEMCAYHNGQRIPNCHDLDLQGLSVPLARSTLDHHGPEEEEPDEDDDPDDNDLDNNDHDIAADDSARVRKKKSPNEDNDNLLSHSGALEEIEAEMAAIVEDPTKTLVDKRECIKKRMLLLLEHRVNIQAEALEIESRHFKWLRYRHKKDGEFMKLKLENERQKLEYERMELLIHEKQLELESKKPQEGEACVGLEILSVRK